MRLFDRVNKSQITKDFKEPQCDHNGYHDVGKSPDPVYSPNEVQVRNLGGYMKESIPRVSHIFATAWWREIWNHYKIDYNSSWKKTCDLLRIITIKESFETLRRQELN